MHTIETRNPENLFGLWSGMCLSLYNQPAENPADTLLPVFSKCSPAMEDGKRYENMVSRPAWVRNPCETAC